MKTILTDESKLLPYCHNAPRTLQVINWLQQSKIWTISTPLVLTSSILIVVGEIRCNHSRKLENIAPLISVDDPVLGLLQNTHEPALHYNSTHTPIFSATLKYAPHVCTMLHYSQQ